MYIVELFFKLKERFSGKNSPKTSDDRGEDLLDETLNCEHIFVPIDSTKEVLACSKCGYLIRTENIPKKDKGDNFFIK